jgi:hypothetical protein
MTYLQDECSYRRVKEEEQFNVGRVLVLSNPPTCPRVACVAIARRFSGTGAVAARQLMTNSKVSDNRARVGCQQHVIHSAKQNHKAHSRQSLNFAYGKVEVQSSTEKGEILGFQSAVKHHMF